MRHFNFWSKIFIFRFWSSQCLRPCRKPRGQKIKTTSFHQYLWNSELETTWISLIGWPHKTGMEKFIEMSKSTFLCFSMAIGYLPTSYMLTYYQRKITLYFNLFLKGHEFIYLSQGQISNIYKNAVFHSQTHCIRG